MFAPCSSLVQSLWTLCLLLNSCYKVLKHLGQQFAFTSIDQPACCRYEAAKQQADTLHKLSLGHLHHEAPLDSNRGHITTILEHDDSTHRPLSDQPEPSYIDTARSMLDEYELAKADSVGSQRNLPRVRVPSRTADHAAQVAIAGNRQISLPDLTSRRAPRPHPAALWKNSMGPARLDSQVTGPAPETIVYLPCFFAAVTALSTQLLLVSPQH